jgi:hypothetical protein
VRQDFELWGWTAKKKGLFNGYSRWMIHFNLAHKITSFSEFFYRSVFLEVETRRLGNWICFRPQVKGAEDACSVAPLRKSYSQSLDRGPTEYVSSPPLHLRTETDPVSKTSCSCSQERWTMEKVQKSSNSVCYTPSSDPFNIYNFNLVFTGFWKS